MGQKFEIGFVEKLDITSIVKDVLRQWWVILMLSDTVAHNFPPSIYQQIN